MTHANEAVHDDVALVVVSYRNAAQTKRCVRSLLNQTLVPRRIIVWDNASPDGAGEQLEREGFGEPVTVRRSPTNLLWTPAVNAALAGATERYVGFCNNDLLFEQPDTIERLVALLAQPGAGAAGPMGSGFGGPQDYASHYQRAFAARSVSDQEFRATGPLSVTYLVGACVLLPRAAWEAVGGLDESMPLGADDFDLALRLRHDGFSLWTDPGIHVRHYSHATAGSPEWELHGGPSWAAFNAKWDSYFATEQEAIEVLWGGEDRGVSRGTGWPDGQYDERIHGRRP